MSILDETEHSSKFYLCSLYYDELLIKSMYHEAMNVANVNVGLTGMIW